MMESALFFFSYHYPHRSLLLAAPFNLHNGKVAVWSCSFIRRKQYIYASQTICLRGVNVFFTTRKRAICGFKARGMARLLPPQAIWCDWKS